MNTLHAINAANNCLMQFNKKAAAGLLLSGLMTLSSASFAAALQNTGFESPNLGSDFQYNPAGASWVFFNNGGIAGNGSLISDYNSDAPEGTQVGIVQNYNGLAGGFYQDFSVSTGENINFSFSAAQRADPQPAQGIQSFDVLLDGNVIASFDNLPTDYATYTTSTVSIGARTHTLKFIGTNLTDDATVFIDDVITNAAAIPEPASLALFAAGFLGFAVSRKKKVA